MSQIINDICLQGALALDTQWLTDKPTSLKQTGYWSANKWSWTACDETSSSLPDRLQHSSSWDRLQQSFRQATAVLQTGYISPPAETGYSSPPDRLQQSSGQATTVEAIHWQWVAIVQLAHQCATAEYCHGSCMSEKASTAVQRTWYAAGLRVMNVINILRWFNI